MLYHMVMLPMTLDDHLKPIQFLHFAVPYASLLLVIAKTSNLMYKLNVQVTTKQSLIGGGVRSCDPLKIFWGFDHITGMAECKVIKFCTQVGYINFSNRMTYHP